LAEAGQPGDRLAGKARPPLAEPDAGRTQRERWRARNRHDAAAFVPTPDPALDPAVFRPGRRAASTTARAQEW